MTREMALARLRGADWLATAAVFFNALDGRAGRTRAVGGIVRDTLLGIERSGTDIDLATELAPEAVIIRAEAAGITAHPTGIEHGTVTLAVNSIAAEVTTLREDVESFGRRAKVRFGTDWFRDAERRDFTMNALYADPDGTLFDPLDGLNDCLAHRVRFIGDPDQRIDEDRLRVFRYFRFAASHGRQAFDPLALNACERAAGTLDALSAERVGAEMVRVLALPEMAATMRQMVRSEILGSDVAPASALDAFERLEAIKGARTAPARLAVLQVSGVDLTALGRRWRLSNAVIGQAESMNGASALALKEDWSALAYFYPAHWAQGIDVAVAIGERDELWRAAALAAVEALAPGRFPISGADLMALGFAPGPGLGRALRTLERLWIESGFRMEKQALLERARLLK